jgi:phosphoserine aminotransferase
VPPFCRGIGEYGLSCLDERGVCAKVKDKMKIYNFSAGPGVLPTPVLKAVQNELLDFAGTGSSVMEVSHRSKEFEACLNAAEADFRDILSIPSNYKVLFMQGGASSQFSAIVYNMVTDLSRPVDYIVTGVWSDKAAQEAKRLGCKVNTVFSSKTDKHNGNIPDDFQFSDAPAYIYYCDNETVNGVEMPVNWESTLPHNVDLVCDMSSNFLSRPVEVEKYAIIFGGAQKNIGPAGLTIVIVRDDLLGRFSDSPLAGPIMFDYKLCADNGSMYNTPPCFAIYVSGLVFKWLLNLGGLDKMNEINQIKSKRLYDALASHPETYSFPVMNPRYRSRMNVPFRILKDGTPNLELEKEFLKGAEALGCRSLAGHRSVGGMRASLYNALEMEAVDVLIKFIHNFLA